MNERDGEPNKVTMFIIEAGSTKREKSISQICEDCFSPPWSLSRRAQKRQQRNHKMTNEEIMALVEKEIEFANTKHKYWPPDSVHASAILNEEAGKLTQACINWENIEPALANLSARQAKERMRKKAVSTAAMAFRFLQSFDEY